MNRPANCCSTNSRSSSSFSRSRVISSSAPNGSSKRNSSGSSVSERAREVRIRMPPESCFGRLFSKPVEPDQLDRLRGAPPPLLLGPAVQLGEQLDVALHAAPRQQRRVLEDVADPLRAHRDGAGGRGLEAGGDPQQGALAAAGRADDGDELPALHREVDVLAARRCRWRSAWPTPLKSRRVGDGRAGGGRRVRGEGHAAPGSVAVRTASRAGAATRCSSTDAATRRPAWST